MMKIAIMQPAYIPWIGYFDLIQRVDTFVFLDDTQFEKQSWQQRNRIWHNGDYRYLTIPVITKGNHFANIMDVEFDPTKKWSKKHLLTIEQSYAQCSHTKEILSVLESALCLECTKLVDITIPIIQTISNRIGFNTKFVRSSELAVSGKRSQKLVNIINALGGKYYLSPNGAKGYIDEDCLLPTSEICLEYQNYSLKDYPQKIAGSFVPYLSIVDLVANVGFERAKQYI